MKQIKIVSRYDKDKILLCGEYESIKDCLEKNRGAYLSGADLSGANLSGAKNYSENHDIFIQLIKNNSNEFTQKQQEIASTIFAFKLCWGSIEQRYKKEGTLIFQKLDTLGWGEYLEKWVKI